MPIVSCDEREVRQSAPSIIMGTRSRVENRNPIPQEWIAPKWIPGTLAEAGEAGVRETEIIDGKQRQLCLETRRISPSCILPALR